MAARSNVPARYVAIFLATVILGFAGSWLFSLYGRSYYMDRDYGQWSAKMQMLDDCDVGDVAIVGDSRSSAAFVPALLGPADVRNLALTGSTPVETYFEVRRILGCARSPRAIVVAFSPSQYQTINWFWSHAARYGLLSFAELEDVRQTALRLGDADLYKQGFGAEPPGLVKNWLYASGFPAYNFSSFVASGFAFRRASNERTRAETFASRGQHLEGDAHCADASSGEGAGKTFQVSTLARFYLERTLADTEAKGVKIAMMTPPVSDLTARGMAPSFRAGFSSFVDDLRAAHPKIDFIGQVLPAMEDCMFGDAYHVNRRGAEAFSQMVATSTNAFGARQDVEGLASTGN